LAQGLLSNPLYASKLKHISPLAIGNKAAMTTIRPKAILTNIKRVRNALRDALGSALWPESVNRVLVTNYYDIATGEFIADHQEAEEIYTKRATKLGKGGGIGPQKGVMAQYSIRANVVVKHSQF